MTRSDQIERVRGAIATLMVSIRPEWDVAGCVAALRKIDGLTIAQLAIGAARYAADAGNLTPAHLADFANRAWDSDWYPPCKTHPQSTRRITGECAGCYADRTAVTEPLPLDRRGKAPTPEQRQQILTAIGLGGRA